MRHRVQAQPESRAEWLARDERNVRGKARWHWRMHFGELRRDEEAAADLWQLEATSDAADFPLSSWQV